MGGQAAAIWEEQPDMEQKKYVAYVGTYTHGNSKAFFWFNVKVKKGNE